MGLLGNFLETLGDVANVVTERYQSHSQQEGMYPLSGLMRQEHRVQGLHSMGNLRKFPLAQQETPNSRMPLSETRQQWFQENGDSDGVSALETTDLNNPLDTLFPRESGGTRSEKSLFMGELDGWVTSSSAMGETIPSGHSVAVDFGFKDFPKALKRNENNALSDSPDLPKETVFASEPVNQADWNKVAIKEALKQSLMLEKSLYQASKQPSNGVRINSLVLAPNQNTAFSLATVDPQVFKKKGLLSRFKHREHPDTEACIELTPVKGWRQSKRTDSFRSVTFGNNPPLIRYPFQKQQAFLNPPSVSDRTQRKNLSTEDPSMKFLLNSYKTLNRRMEHLLSQYFEVESKQAASS